MQRGTSRPAGSEALSFLPCTARAIYLVQKFSEERMQDQRIIYDPNNEVEQQIVLTRMKRYALSNVGRYEKL